MANENSAAVTPVKNELDIVRQDVLDNVQKQLEVMQNRGRIHFPSNYSAANALQAAWLKMQDTKDKNSKPILESCTRASVMNYLLKTVVSGLNPSKDQVYYIPTDGVLTVFISYFGTAAMAKRHGMKDDPFTEVVYKGDEFVYEIDPVERTKRVTKHVQKIENVNAENIVAAYAVAAIEDGTFKTEIMTIDQIKKNWQRGTAKGNSPMHKDHPEQACRRTVISRLCKMIVKASDDSDLVMDMFDDTDDAEVNAQISENANQKVVDVDFDIVNESSPAGNEPAADPKEESEPKPAITVTTEPEKSGQLPGQLKMDPGF